MKHILGRTHNSTTNRHAMVMIKDNKARAISERLLFITIHSFLGTGKLKEKAKRKELFSPKHRLLDRRSDDLCPRFI